MKSVLRDQLRLVIFVLFAVILPFSNRAVYMDEHLYLGLAESALTSPLYPQDMPWLYFGTWFPNAADHTHPPLGEYHLAIIYKLTGHFSEVPFRILFGAPYAVLAILGFYGLAACWVSHPFPVTLLFTMCPPFFVMAPTLMMDLPSVGCLLMGLRIFLSAKNRMTYVAAAGLLFTWSLGTGYTAAIPLCLLLVWSIYEGRSIREIVAIVAPFLALGVWLIFMTIHFGEFPLKSTLAYTLSQFKPLHNLTATLSFIGGLAVFPWILSVLERSPRTLLLSLVFGALPLVYVAWASKFEAILYFVMASWGAMLILRFSSLAANRFRARSDWCSLFHLAWFFFTLAFFILAADMMTARYLLLCLPPLYLVLFADVSSSNLRRLMWPTMALSLSIAIADYRFVDGYRSWVVKTIPALQASGYQVWSATESGLRFYLERQGAQGLDSTDLRPGGTDLVVQHSGLFRYSLAEDLATMLVEVRQFEIPDAFPLRTFGKRTGAGFHDSRVGLIPFSFSTLPLDGIQVSQVSPFASTLPVRAGPGLQNVPVWTPEGVELRQSGAVAKFNIPYLRNVQWSGQLMGSGVVEFDRQSVTLRLTGGTTAVWRNFRIVPKGF